MVDTVERDNSAFLIHPLKTFRGKWKSHPLWRLFVQVIAPIFDVLGAYVLHFPRKLLYWHYLSRRSSNQSAALLRTEGIEIVPAKPEFVEFARWLVSRIPKDLLAREKSRLLADAEEDAFCATVETKLEVDTRVKILDFCLSDNVLGSAVKYFGLVPRLGSVIVMYNVPKPQQGPVGSQEWHRDSGIYKSLNLFMCLSDVDDESGAYYAIPQSFIPRHAEVPLEQVDTRLSAWTRYRLSTELIQKYVPGVKPVRLAGPPGTSAFVDPGLCYHRGGYCRTRDRLMIQIAFVLDAHTATADIAEQLGLQGHPAVEKYRKHTLYRKVLDGNIGNLHWKLGLPNPVYLINGRVLSYYLWQPRE